MTSWSIRASAAVLVPSLARITCLLGYLPSTLDRTELGGDHQRGLLLDQIAGLVELLNIDEPVRIGPHCRTPARAVGCVFVDPVMHDGIDVAAFGVHVGQRRAEVPGLRGKPILLVDIQMRLRHAGLDAVGSVVDEHVVLLGPSAAPIAAAENSFGPRTARSIAQ